MTESISRRAILQRLGAIAAGAGAVAIANQLHLPPSPATAGKSELSLREVLSGRAGDIATPVEFRQPVKASEVLTSAEIQLSLERSLPPGTTVQQRESLILVSHGGKKFLHKIEGDTTRQLQEVDSRLMIYQKLSLDRDSAGVYNPETNKTTLFGINESTGELIPITGDYPGNLVDETYEFGNHPLYRGTMNTLRGKLASSQFNQTYSVGKGTPQDQLEIQLGTATKIEFFGSDITLPPMIMNLPSPTMVMGKLREGGGTQFSEVLMSFLPVMTTSDDWRQIPSAFVINAPPSIQPYHHPWTMVTDIPNAWIAAFPDSESVNIQHSPNFPQKLVKGPWGVLNHYFGLEDPTGKLDNSFTPYYLFANGKYFRLYDIGDIPESITGEFAVPAIVKQTDELDGPGYFQVVTMYVTPTGIGNRIAAIAPGRRITIKGGTIEAARLLGNSQQGGEVAIAAAVQPKVGKRQIVTTMQGLPTDPNPQKLYDVNLPNVRT